MTETAMTDETAKRLEVALEAFRRLFVGDDPFHRLANAARSHEDEPAEWTRGFAEVSRHTETYGFADARDRMEAQPAYGVKEPVHRPGDAKKPEEAGPTDSRGPIPVLIMGPNPLPVTFTGQLPGEKPEAKAASSAGKTGTGGGPAIANTLARHFAILFGPLMALHTVLGQANSGFGVFQKSLSLIGTALAPILLPPFVLLATMFVGLAETIHVKMMPALMRWYDWFMKHGLPAADTALENADTLTRSVVDRQGLLNEMVQNPEVAEKKKSAFRRLIEDPIFGFGTYVQSRPSQSSGKSVAGLAGRIVSGAAANLAVAGPGVSGPSVSQPEARRPGSKDKPAGTTATIASAGRDVLKSLSLAIGPKASISGLAEVEKQRQLAAVGADPIEMRSTRMMIDTFRPLAEKMLGKLEEMEKTQAAAGNKQIPTRPGPPPQTGNTYPNAPQRG